MKIFIILFSIMLINILFNLIWLRFKKKSLSKEIKDRFDLAIDTCKGLQKSFNEPLIKIKIDNDKKYLENKLKRNLQMDEDLRKIDEETQIKLQEL